MLMIPEIVKNNYNGIIVEPQSPLELANATIKLLKNATMRKQMGINSKKRYEKYFSDKHFFMDLMISMYT